MIFHDIPYIQSIDIQTLLFVIMTFYIQFSEGSLYSFLDLPYYPIY